ncbi:MAG TPA: heme ABC transporter ATP-binding protein [Vicinamibacterales bacterium]|nr:heme ABC transporter ATP-binding protein [Vicinamibacterales bacterium]
MLTAEAIGYRVGRRTILEDVTAAFEPRRLHLVIGPNGAGKSTLVKLLARLVPPSHGRIRYGSTDATTLGHRELARRRAVLSQAVEVAFPIPARELVMMGRYPHFTGQPSPDDEAICDEMMRLLDVVALGEQPYATLSGGEKQRVNFARVLAQIWRPVDADGRYLFLDEPLTFLDIQHQLRFMQLVRGFADQDDVVVVGVVHDLNLAARFADRVILLDAGAVAVIGTPDEVLTPEHLRNAFHVRPTVVTNPATGGRHLIFD